MSHKVFISHKNVEDSENAGQAIEDYLLNELNYERSEVFFDGKSLEGGMNWNDEIVNFLTTSDVVIVLLDTETVKSNWVQREIDMARARNISILPITLGDYDEIASALERFDLEQTQFMAFPKSFSTSKIAETIKKIAERIPKLAAVTIENQRADYEAWQQKRKASTQKTRASLNNSAYIFSHPTHPDLKFHIVTGDSTRISEFDVLVNTENNYMQMARFFETNTLSWSIRTKGAYFDGEMLIEDTIQDQLYKQAVENARLPVPERHVLVTTAGHEFGDLRRFTDYRYIFHAAAVQVNLVERAVKPSGEVTRTILNCIKKIDAVDRVKGKVATETQVFVEASEDYIPLKSILFPAFGSGKGGKALVEAASDMIRFFARDDIPHFIAQTGSALQKIGFSVFAKEDIDVVVGVFNQYNFKLESPSN